LWGFESLRPHQALIKRLHEIAGEPFL
jgi:hypothetical protein